MKLFELREGVRKMKIGWMAFLVQTAVVLCLSLWGTLQGELVINALRLPFLTILVVVGGNAVEHVTKIWNHKPPA